MLALRGLFCRSFGHYRHDGCEVAVPELWKEICFPGLREKRIMSFSAVAPSPFHWSCMRGLFSACSGHSGSCHGCSGLRALPFSGENRGSLKLLVKPCKKILLLWRCSDPDMFLGPNLLTVPSSRGHWLPWMNVGPLLGQVAGWPPQCTVYFLNVSLTDIT